MSVVTGIFLGLATTGMFVATIISVDGDTRERGREDAAKFAQMAKAASVRWLLPAFGFFFVLSMIPTTDQMFHIRLNLIKFELASPDNVRKGTEEIANIAKKLECKYLGCEEPKPSEPAKKSEK